MDELGSCGKSIRQEVSPGKISRNTNGGWVAWRLSQSRAQPREDDLQLGNETTLLDFHAIGAQRFISFRSLATYETGIHDSMILR